jgi:hypothetical protein
VFQLRKPAFAVFVGLVVAIAAACGSSSATATPTSVAPGNSTAPGVSVTPVASVPATANANDASSLITQALSGSSTVKSFHIKFTASGTIKGAVLKSATSGSLATDLVLTGTALEGDVDLANSAAHLALNVPPIASFGGQPIAADVILANNALYYKVSLLGPKYSMLDLKSLSSSLSGLTSGLPVAVPTPGASAMAGVTDQIAQLRQQLDTAGAKATVVGTEQIGGQDAVHINVTIPVDYINQQITAAEAASSASPDPALAGAKLDTSTFDVWIYKANNQLAQIHFTAASSVVGNIDLMLTLTNYDKPVTIAAPPAGEISSAPPVFP